MSDPCSKHCERDWCGKNGFILKILQINCYHFERILSPPPKLFTAAYKFHIILSSATSHQLTPCSAGLPFFISPRPQTASFVQCAFHFRKQKSQGALRWTWREGAGSLECMYWLKIASWQGHWAGALSWCRIHYFFFHNSGLSYLTHSRSLLRTSK
jgi:hypothetical protein